MKISTQANTNNNKGIEKDNKLRPKKLKIQTIFKLLL